MARVFPPLAGNRACRRRVLSARPAPSPRPPSPGIARAGSMVTAVEMFIGRLVMKRLATAGGCLKQKEVSRAAAVPGGPTPGGGSASLCAPCLSAIAGPARQRRSRYRPPSQLSPRRAPSRPSPSPPPASCCPR